MRLSILMVFEAASLGLSLKIPKCSFFPRHSIKALGTIVDLSSFRFSVTRSRAQKIRGAIARLQQATHNNHNKVPAKLVASFIGLIWSIAPCCHRAASVMVRSITATLTNGLQSRMQVDKLSLARILNQFWSGTVAWSTTADAQLRFWNNVRFEGLSAPISADVLGLALEQSFWYPGDFNHSDVSFLFQDASATASGGGMLSMRDGRLQPYGDLFLAEFSLTQAELSSTLRELLGILWCIRATSDHTKHRLVFFCDNWQSCRAILRGSRVPAIQAVAEEIFFWCLTHNKTCWPIWIPRTHALIQEADRRSRLKIPHDERSPTAVVLKANELARRFWGRDISFDQAASHRSAIIINGKQLPFNAVCFQPGASGIDMFRCPRSWVNNINYMFPPAPIAGRLITFLPSSKARSIVALPRPIANEWWSFAVQPHATGLRMSEVVGSFQLFVFDFSGTTAPDMQAPFIRVIACL